MKAAGKSGAAIATTAFALALSSATLVSTATGASAAGEEAKVHCMGANACKGHSDCKTANNACKGQNACKGEGFVGMTKEDCEAAGGKVEE